MSQLIPLENLIIPKDRQRDELDSTYISELADSIEANGLLHPIALRDDHKTLIAGECRSAACALLHKEGRTYTFSGEPVPPGYIPFIPQGRLTETQLVEIELEENIRRKDLTWQQRTQAIAKLERLRNEQASSEGRKVTTKELASEVMGIPVTSSGGAQKTVREARELAQYLDDPDVMKAKTQKEALKIVNKKKAAEHRKRLAEEFGETFASSPFPHTIHQGRMEEILPTLPDKTYTCIITDPPYGVDAHAFGEQASAAHEYEDSKEYAISLYQILARESARVCTDEAHLYVFLDIGLFYEISDIFAASGWTPWYRPLFWFKGNNAGMLPAPEYGPRNTYEGILYCRKGGRKTRRVGPDVISVPALSRPAFGAQKPYALYEELLSRSTDPGDQVLDTFAGAGPVFRAAKNLSLRATGIELNQEKIGYIYNTYLEDEEDEGTSGDEAGS